MKQGKLHFLVMVIVSVILLIPATMQAVIPPNDNEIWWGYYKNTDELLGFGSGEVTHYDCAIFANGADAQLKDHNIRAVRFVMQGTDAVKDVKVWLSSALPSRPQDATICVIDVPTADLKEHEPTEVLLPSPYKVTSAGVYIGYSFTLTKAETMAQKYPVLTTADEEEVDGALFIRSDVYWTSWDKLSGQGYGKMAIQALVDGNFKKNAVKAIDFGEAITVKNDSVQVPLEITNIGTEGISSIDYTISTNGAVEFTRHVDFEKTFVGYDCNTTTNIVLLADPTLGQAQKQITITKVNGFDNEAAPNNVANGTLITLESSAPHRTVFEEFTATWAPASPWGFAGKRLTKEKYPNDVVWISAHVGTDPMAISQYQPVYNNIGSGLAPSGLINRIKIADPYFGSTLPRQGYAVDLDLEQYHKRAVEAAIDMSDPHMDKNGQIILSTNVEFQYSRNDAPYAIGYVLLADGLKGTETNWHQSNIFPGWVGTGYFDETDENLNVYATMPNPITDLIYDDVAIASYGLEKGLEGSINAPIVMGQSQTHNFTMELGANPLAQNLNKLRIVAILFNTSTGKIVNAVEKPIIVSDEFATNAAETKDFGTPLVLVGQTSTIPLNIECTGKTDVSTLDVVVEMAGQSSKTERIVLDTPLPFGNSTVINVPVTMPDEVKNYVTKFTISKVNDIDNQAVSSRITSNGTLRALMKAPMHKTFIEEFTGTWCGFCPRGTLGLQLSEERHPGKFVAVAVHGNDVMTIDSYYPILVTVEGYPTAFVNRQFETDPYMGNQTKFYGLGDVIETEAAKLTEASINLNPLYDEATNTVKVDANATFYINSDTAPYAIGYILVADGLEGAGSKWRQSNYYASYKNSGQLSDDPDIQVLIEADSYLDWPYNHVPIDTKGIEKGISGSIAAPLVAGQPQSHSVVFNLEGNNLVQDTDNLKVVALIFNTETGEVVNAEEAHVGDYVAISDINTTTSADIKQIFTVDGKLVNSVQKGVNIVRMSDGTVKKVIVK